MKRTSKSVFFIVTLLIVALAYTTFFGVYTYYGDRRDTQIRGVADIRYGIDIRGGIDVTFGPADETIAVDDSQMAAVKDVIAQRLVSKGITDYEIYADTDNKQVIVRFPWQSEVTNYDTTAAIEELGKTAELEFHMGSETKTKTDANGKAVLDADGNEIKVPSGALVLSGDDVESAEAKFITDDNNNSKPGVILKLKESGKQAFATATATQAANKGTISIWLDNQKISDPKVEDTINDGTATISGGFEEYKEAVSLANLINSGALPFSISVKSSGTITPTMGMQALDIMALAGTIAFILVALFMILYYRLPGFVAAICLLGQVTGSLAVVSGYFGFLNSFTLTLPGIAGIIMSIGMGVDANIITAERIKEEILIGKTIDGSIAKGSANSFWAIFDGNITVMIVAAVLMGVFGSPSGFWATILWPILRWFPASTTGAVYSFGFTLFAGIIFNFLMGVTASRLMLKSITRFKFLRKPWLLGGKRA